jgi:hypothetical protein
MHFSLKLTAATYWPEAHFNVPIQFEHYFGQDNEHVRVEVMGELHAASLIAIIDRRNQTNHHPRLQFQADYRRTYQDWKQANGCSGDELSVDILGINHVRLSIIPNKV